MPITFNSNNFDANNWKDLMSKSAPNSPKASHAYICYNKQTKNFFLSQNKKGKLSLRDICKITKMHLASLKNDGGDLGSNLLKMQNRSAEKLKGRIFFTRPFVKIVQCIKNAFAGLGFKSNGVVVAKLSQEIPSKQPVKTPVPQTIANSQGGATQASSTVENKSTSITTTASEPTIVNKSVVAPEVKPEASDKKNVASEPKTESVPKSEEVKPESSDKGAKTSESKADEPTEKTKPESKPPIDPVAEAAAKKAQRSQEFRDKYLEAKKAGSNTKGIIEQALGKSEEECAFEGVAEVIAEEDIDGIMINLSKTNTDSSKIDANANLFKNMLKLIDQCKNLETRDGLLIAACLPFMTEHKLNIFLSELNKNDEAHLFFARNLLAIACDDEYGEEVLKAFYLSNPDLVEEAFKDPSKLPQKYYSKDGLSEIINHYNLLKKNKSTPLSKIEEAEDIMDTFIDFKDLSKARAFFNLEYEDYNNKFKEKLIAFFKEIAPTTVESLAWQKNNSLGIKLSSDSKSFDFLFECFANADQEKRFVLATIDRQDLGNKAFVALMSSINLRGSKADLFEVMLENFEIQRLSSFINDLPKYNDNKGDSGPFISAVVTFLASYLATNKIKIKKEDRLVIVKDTLLKLNPKFDFASHPELEISKH